MKEVVEAINSRIKSPYFGYAVLAFFALNWRGIFLLITSKGDPHERLAVFDGETSTITLVVLPLVIGAAVAASNQWIRYVFGLVSKKPLELVDNLYLEAEHKKTIRQSELEQSRSDLFAVKEKELIDRAKRDEEVGEIEDDAAKKKLAAQLEALRKERDELSEQLKSQSSKEVPSINGLSPDAVEILIAAAKSKNGNIIKPKTLGGRSIQAGGISFGSESQPEFVRYDAALSELVSSGFVQEMGYKGEMFELTHDGWQVANTL